MASEAEARAALVRLLQPLAAAMRTDLDAATWAAYYRALKDVPTALLSAAVDRLLREPRTFFPKAQEIRAAAEAARQALLALHPYERCADCDEHCGFVPVLVDGVTRLERCPCFAAHQKRIAALEIGGGPLMLEAATVGDS